MAAPTTMSRLEDSDELWRNNRGLIHDLYQGQDGTGHTLAHVRKVLIDHHRFPDLPLPRYEARLKDVGLRKKFKKDDWRLIWPHWRKLQSEGRTPEVWLCGSRMPPEKAWKEIRRNVPRAQRSLHVQTVLPPLPPGVVVQGEGDVPPSSPGIVRMPSLQTRVTRRSQYKQLLQAPVPAPIVVPQNTEGNIPCNNIVTRPRTELSLWVAPSITDLALSPAPHYPELPIMDLKPSDFSKIFKGMWLRNLPWLQARGYLRSLSMHQDSGWHNAFAPNALTVDSLFGLPNVVSTPDNYEDIPVQLFRAHDINLQSSRALSVEIDPFHFLERAVFRLSNRLVDFYRDFRSREDGLLWTILFTRLPNIVFSVLARSKLESFRAAWASLVDIATRKCDEEALAKVAAAVAEDDVDLRVGLIKPLLKVRDSKNLEIILKRLPGGEHTTATGVERMARWVLDPDARCSRILVSWLMTVVCEADYKQALQANVGVVPNDGVFSSLEKCGLPVMRILGLESPATPMHACRACGLRQADMWSAIGEQVYELLVRHRNCGGAEYAGLHYDAREHLDTFDDGKRHHGWSMQIRGEDIASEVVNADWQTSNAYCTELLGWIASRAPRDQRGHIRVQDLMETALYLAAGCEQGLLDGVLMEFRLLLRRGVRPSARSISKVVENDRLDRTETLQLLQDEGVDMTTLGDLALGMAVRKMRLRTAQWLLDAGVDICATHFNRRGVQVTLMGMVPDHRWPYPSSDKDPRAGLEMVYLLVRNGLAPRLHPSDTTPINLVASLLQKGLYCGCDPSEIYQLLRHVDLVSPDAVALTTSSVEGSCFHVLEWLLDIGTPRHPELLTKAISQKVPRDIAQRILDSTADVNAHGFASGTSLMAVCRELDKDLCLQLINKGANVNMAYDSSLTALHYVCEESTLTEAEAAEQVAIVQLLLQHGAQVNAQKQNGGTALCQVAANGNLELAIILLDGGADPNLNKQHPPYLPGRGSHSYQALDCAASEGRLDMVQLLLNAGAESGWQLHSLYDGAIALATIAGHREVTKLLIRHAKYSDVEAMRNVYTKYDIYEYWASGYKSEDEAILLEWFDV